MEKESRGFTYKILGCLIVAALLQTTIPRYISPTTGIGLWLSYIDWFLLITIYIGLQREPVKSLVTGTIAGIVQDLYSGGGARGISGLAYVFAAYITHRIAAFIVVDNMLVRILTVSAASVANTGIRHVIYALLNLTPPIQAVGRTIGSDIVLGLFANLIASFFLYFIMDRLFKKDHGMAIRRSEARRRRI